MHVCMYACICKCICICVCVCVCVYVCMYVSIYLSIYLCIYVSMYVCVYVSMYVSMYLCTHRCNWPNFTRRRKLLTQVFFINYIPSPTFQHFFPARPESFGTWPCSQLRLAPQVAKGRGLRVSETGGKLLLLRLVKDMEHLRSTDFCNVLYTEKKGVMELNLKEGWVSTKIKLG